MADETETPTPTPADATNGADTPKTRISQSLSQYVRDMSFENVSAQKGTKMEGQPDISVQVGLDAKKLDQDNHYEVAIKLNVSAKTKDAGAMLFALELDYAGTFAIKNVPDNQLHPFLMIECPRLLFPFLRRIVSDVTRDGGFPPLNLETIDFVALYRNELQRRAAQQQAEGQPVN